MADIVATGTENNTDLGAGYDSVVDAAYGEDDYGAGEPGAEISVSAANAGFVAGTSNGTIDVTGDFNSSPEVYLPASSANQDRHDCTGPFCTNYPEPDDGIYFMVSYEFIVTDDSGTHAPSSPARFS